MFGFGQVCTRVPVRVCVKYAAAASSRSAGARRPVTSALKTTTAQSVPHPWLPVNTSKTESIIKGFPDQLEWPRLTSSVPQSPDVNPILCPGDAFCPEGSTAPGYCMETFFRKAGEECELAPVTIALLVIGGGGMSEETCWKYWCSGRKVVWTLGYHLDVENPCQAVIMKWAK